MLKSILTACVIAAIVLIVAVFAMAFRPLFTKNGRFPNIHIGGSKAMRDRGISCAATQDREARKK